MPSWLQNKQIVITKTHNGWSVSPDKNTPVEQCVVFETWAALAYWLDVNYANPAP